MIREIALIDLNGDKSTLLYSRAYYPGQLENAEALFLRILSEQFQPHLQYTSTPDIKLLALYSVNKRGFLGTVFRSAIIQSTAIMSGQSLALPVDLVSFVLHSVNSRKFKSYSPECSAGCDCKA